MTFSRLGEMYKFRFNPTGDHVAVTEKLCNVACSMKSVVEGTSSRKDEIAACFCIAAVFKINLHDRINL